MAVSKRWGVPVRKCACGRRATRERVGTKWVPLTECRRCLAATRIGDVVKGLAGARLKYVEKELESLRTLEAWVRGMGLKGASIVTFQVEQVEGLEGLLRDLDTLRSLQSQRGEE